MPFNAFINPDNNQLVGPISVINDPLAPQNIAQAVATGTAAIAIPLGAVRIKLTAAAAVTGATLPAGSYDGQLLFIKVTTAAANTITFAAVGTSNVAGGAAVSIAGLATHLFQWDAADGNWAQIGPLAN